MGDKPLEKATIKAKAAIDWTTGNLKQLSMTTKDAEGNSVTEYMQKGVTGPLPPHHFEVRDAEDRTVCVGDDKPVLPAVAHGLFAGAMKDYNSGKVGIAGILSTVDVFTIGVGVQVHPGDIPGLCKPTGKEPKTPPR